MQTPQFDKMPCNTCIYNIQTLHVDTHTVRLDYSGRFERNSIYQAYTFKTSAWLYIHKYSGFVPFLSVGEIGTVKM